MSFVPGSFFSTPTNNTSFHPLFRLLDDFEQHRNTSESESNQHAHHNHNHPNKFPIMKSFTPKFDVKETVDAYELHGDLPGVEQKDIEIEFADIQTITIKGRTERASTPSSDSIEDSPSQKAIEDSSASSSKAAPHKASVEDSAEDNDGNGVVVTTPKPFTEGSTTSNTITTTTSKKIAKHSEPVAKYWVSERSVGEFSRSFTFPVRVDQDAVKASMKNGVLSIVVPKAKKHEARKIAIQ